MKQYEEYRVVGTPWGWVILVVFSACILGWGMLLHHMVAEGTPHWDFGAVEDAPGESIYSSQVPPAGEAQPQIPPLPEARSANALSGPTTAPAAASASPLAAPASSGGRP